jgi:hypothetical protein
MTKKLDELIAHRSQLLQRFIDIGDMRQGSISENFRRCGSSSCCCAAPDHPGHGPYYAFTRKVGGKTKTINRRPGPELNKLKEEVTEYQRFKELCHEVLQINEAICNARPIPEEKGDRDAPTQERQRK